MKSALQTMKWLFIYSVVFLFIREALSNIDEQKYMNIFVGDLLILL